MAAERARSQTIAVAQLSSRTAAFGRREKLLTGVFEAAREGLERIPKEGNYSQVVERLLLEALPQLGAGSASVQADEAARKILVAGLLENISSELNIAIKLGEPLKHGTGVIVETEDGRMNYDNTLDTRLKRLQDTLRSAVYHILMGEPL
jgi:vacuolar-type H+-ATPase subunit E/Vma4